MNLLQRAANWIQGADQRSQSGYALTDPQILAMLGGNGPGRIRVTPESSLKLATVFRCVNLLSTIAAAMPWELMEKRDDGSYPALKHPNYYLCKYRPHKLQTSFVWRQTLFAQALLWGNGYAHIVRNGVYRPTSLKIYHPEDVSVRIYNDELYYTFRNGPSNVSSEDVIHLKLFTTDGLIGRSAISVGAESLSVPAQAQQYANAFFENGTRVSGILTTEKSLKTEAKKNLRDSWGSGYSGGANAGKTPVLDEGLNYQQIGIPPGDFQLLNFINVSDKTICTWFGVPQHLAGILEHATFSNIEHQDLEFMKYSLQPHIINFEQEYDYKTLRTQELGVIYSKINLNGIIRADFKTRYEGYRTGVQNGFMSINDVRALEDLNPIEGGDDHWIQQNMMPLNKAEQILMNKNGASAPAAA